jgi:hypothetical protein
MINSKIIEFFSVIVCMIVASILGYTLIDTGALSSIEDLVTVFSGLGWFIATFIIATIFTAYLVVIADTKFFIRFLAIPSWLMFTISLVITVDNFLGHPYPTIPPQGQVGAYRVIVGENRNDRTIEAWMYFPIPNKTRLYTFPYSEKFEDALREGRSSNMKGYATEVNLSAIGNPAGGDKQGGDELVNYDIPHTGLPPKTPDENTGMVEAVPDDYIKSVTPSDNIIVEIPGGGTIEIPVGTSFSVSPTGEVEIIEPSFPQIDKEKQMIDDYDTGHHPGRGRQFIP